MPTEIKLLSPGDADVLANVAPGTFDNPIDARGTREFLSDGRHHLAVAVDDNLVVGFISAVHYSHPDRRYPEMWINEIQVAPTHRRGGVGKALMDRMLQLARDLGCTEAWVLTERDNVPAVRFYSALGGKADADGVLGFTFTVPAGANANPPAGDIVNAAGFHTMTDDAVGELTAQAFEELGMEAWDDTP